MKTHSGAKKRFTITASGRVKHKQAAQEPPPVARVEQAEAQAPWHQARQRGARGAGQAHAPVRLATRSQVSPTWDRAVNPTAASRVGPAPEGIAKWLVQKEASRPVVVATASVSTRRVSAAAAASSGSRWSTLSATPGASPPGTVVFASVTSARSGSRASTRPFAGHGMSVLEVHGCAEARQHRPRPQDPRGPRGHRRRRVHEDRRARQGFSLAPPRSLTSRRKGPVADASSLKHHSRAARRRLPCPHGSRRRRACRSQGVRRLRRTTGLHSRCAEGRAEERRPVPRSARSASSATRS